MARSGLAALLVSGLVHCLSMSGNPSVMVSAYRQNVYEYFDGTCNWCDPPKPSYEESKVAFRELQHAFNAKRITGDPCNRWINSVSVYSYSMRYEATGRRRRRRNLRGENDNNSTTVDDNNEYDLVVLETGHHVFHEYKNISSFSSSRTKFGEEFYGSSPHRKLAYKVEISIKSKAYVDGNCNCGGARLVPTASGRRKLWTHENYLPSNWVVRDEQGKRVRANSATNMKYVYTLSDAK